MIPRIAGALALVGGASWLGKVVRLVAMLVALVSFVVLVDLPILVGWLVLGRTWVAEEIGVVLTALLAVILGSRWLLRGFGAPRISKFAQ